MSESDSVARIVKTVQTITKTPVGNIASIVDGTVEDVTYSGDNIINIKIRIKSSGNIPNEDIVLNSNFIILSRYCTPQYIYLDSFDESQDTTLYKAGKGHRHAYYDYWKEGTNFPTVDPIQAMIRPTTEETEDFPGKSKKNYTDYTMPKILLWRGLQKNDKVRMLKLNNGQKYYVMERLNGTLQR